MGSDLYWLSQRGCQNPQHLEWDSRQAKKSLEEELERQRQVKREQLWEAQRDLNAHRKGEKVAVQDLEMQLPRGNEPAKIAAPSAPAPEVNANGMQKQVAGKLRMEALPHEFKELLARHMAYGCFVKEPPYPLGNWRRGGFDTELLAAAERHILAHQKGEEVDAESGSLHLVAAAANLLMIAAVRKESP